MTRDSGTLRLVAAVGSLCLIGISIVSVAHAQPNAGGTIVLQNDRLGLALDRNTGTLTSLENKLAGETYQVQGDEFDVEAIQFRTALPDAKLVSLKVAGDGIAAEYQTNDLAVRVQYTLRGHFVEKQVSLTSPRDYGLKKVIVSKPRFSGPALQIVEYRYPKFGRKPGEEAVCTCFGRTMKGGFFTGVEMPYAASSANGQQVVLGYAPSLKVRGGEKLACEPVYFGVYRRQPHDEEMVRRQPDLERFPGQQPLEEDRNDLPLPSESEAMLAMTSAILGPPRFGLVPTACGWASQMSQYTYTDQSAKEDMKSLDFLAACGIDWITDSHPWGGETVKMNALGANDKYEPGPLVREFLEHAQKVAVKVMMWSSMNKTHAWWKQGMPFRSDKPEWLLDAGAGPPKNAPEWRRTTKGTLCGYGNCLANRPFFDWLLRINLEGIATGSYKAWGMDGDFFGGGGWYTTTVRVDCQSDLHDHLPGDSNYACQQALNQLVASVREQDPDIYIGAFRPFMDLGVWSLRNVNACFTQLEDTGMWKKDNLSAGDRVRTWSRARVHREFMPHYLDWPLLFTPAFISKPSDWSSEKLDYVLLSALSSSPNQLYYMPTKSGIPEKDKAELRKWLDWGRKNAEYLKVRKDLPDWPAAGGVDGNAHIVGQRGFVFLFNPGTDPLPGEFMLTEEGIGLQHDGAYRVTQYYPVADHVVAARYGEPVRWDVPGQTALILEIQPAAQ